MAIIKADTAEKKKIARLLPGKLIMEGMLMTSAIEYTCRKLNEI